MSQRFEAKHGGGGEEKQKQSDAKQNKSRSLPRRSGVGMTMMGDGARRFAPLGWQDAVEFPLVQAGWKKSGEIGEKTRTFGPKTEQFSKDLGLNQVNIRRNRYKYRIET